MSNNILLLFIFIKLFYFTTGTEKLIHWETLRTRLLLFLPFYINWQFVKNNFFLRRGPDIDTFSKLTLLLKNAELEQQQDWRPVLPENLMYPPSTHNPWNPSTKDEAPEPYEVETRIMKGTCKRTEHGETADASFFELLCPRTPWRPIKVLLCCFQAALINWIDCYSLWADSSIMLWWIIQEKEVISIRQWIASVLFAITPP